MIKIKQAVIVEGKYDKIKLSGIIDAPIIQTDGFGVSILSPSFIETVGIWFTIRIPTLTFGCLVPLT